MVSINTISRDVCNVLYCTVLKKCPPHEINVKLINKKIEKADQ